MRALLLVVTIFPLSGLADSCFVYCDATSCHSDYGFSLDNQSWNINQNNTGETIPISPSPSGTSFELDCHAQNFYWRFEPNIAIDAADNTRLILNDYIGLSFTDRGRLSYSPNAQKDSLSYHYTPSSPGPSGHGDDHWAERYNANTKTITGIYVRRPFVGTIRVPRTLLYTVYATTGESDSIDASKYISRIYFSADVTVPQSCELDAGTVITMDFGNIGAPLFAQAGAGNKPAGVNPKTHTIAVQCKNIDAQALLSMRIEADNASGNIIVSDNKDVGFVVADSSRNPLTPNNIDSKIKFQLDDNSAATVPITAWPVSVTGNKPAEGRFTSEGYLRIDFD